MSKPTPGPWTIRQTYRYVNSDLYGCDGEHEMGFSLSAPSLWAGGDPEIAALHEAESEANARLIASAPELLAALKQIQALTDVNCDEAQVIAVAAIAKAEGE